MQITTQNELTPMMSSNTEMSSLQICQLPDAPVHNELKKIVRNLIKQNELILTNDFGAGKISHTNFVCKKIDYLDKQNKRQEQYVFNKDSAIFVAAKISNLFLKHLINKYNELEQKNNSLLQIQLEQYRKQFSIEDNRVVIYDESEIPKEFIKLSDILRKTKSGLPLDRIHSILLALRVPMVQYQSTYESSDGSIHKGKIATAFEESKLRNAFDTFKADLTQVTKCFSHSNILNGRIKYVNNITF